MTVKSKDDVCAFCLSSNFVLEDVDFGVKGSGTNSGGVCGPSFHFLGGGGCSGGYEDGGVLKAEGFVLKSIGGSAV